MQQVLPQSPSFSGPNLSIPIATNSKLVVNNLPEDITEYDLKGLFGEFGCLRISIRK